MDSFHHVTIIKDGENAEVEDENKFLNFLFLL